MKIMAKKRGCIAIPLRCKNCESTNLRIVDREEWLNNSQSNEEGPGELMGWLSELARGKQSYFVCENCGHYDRF